MERRQPAGNDGYALELRGIVKRFPGVLANDHVDLSVLPGQIHALLGENGAGKTTLMSILYGLYQPDEGEIFVRGERVHFRSPLDAIAAGLGMVHQSFKLFPSMTVAENVIYRSEPRRGGFVDRTEAIRSVASLAERFGLRVNPRARVGDLPVGVRQRVEILKLLYRNAEILILDEPTGVLTPQERDGLFEVGSGAQRDDAGGDHPPHDGARPPGDGSPEGRCTGGGDALLPGRHRSGWRPDGGRWCLAERP